MCGQSQISDNTVSLRSIQQLVNKSAKRLDKKMKGWFKKIDVSTFDANMSHLCIVGQLGLSDNDMDQKLGYHIDNARKIVHKGQVISVGYYDDNVPLKNNDVLTRLWKHQIAVRVRKASQKRPAKRKVVHAFRGNSIIEMPVHGC